MIVPSSLAAEEDAIGIGHGLHCAGVAAAARKQSARVRVRVMARAFLFRRILSTRLSAAAILSALLRE